MNKIFRIIWNRATDKWVVTSELGRIRNTKSYHSLSRTIVSFLFVLLSFNWAGAAGGSITSTGGITFVEEPPVNPRRPAPTVSIGHWNLIVFGNDNVNPEGINLIYDDSHLTILGVENSNVDFANNLHGRGTVFIRSGNDVTLLGDNGDNGLGDVGFFGNINVDNGSILTLKDRAIEGGGTITIGSTPHVTRNAQPSDIILNNSEVDKVRPFASSIRMITSTGDKHDRGTVIKRGAGEVVMVEDQYYQGNTEVAEGALTLKGIIFNKDKGDGSNAHYNSLTNQITVRESAQLNLDGSDLGNSSVTIDRGALLTGTSQLNGLSNAGTIYVGSMKPDLSSITDANDTNTGQLRIRRALNDVANGNNLDNINASIPKSDGNFQQMIINSDYMGIAGSELYLATRMNGDDVTTNANWSGNKDLFVIRGNSYGQSDVYIGTFGDVTKGTTGTVQNGIVTNNNGILLIEVQGARSEAEFIHKNPQDTVSGIYAYTLNKGADGSWYLNYKYGDESENDGRDDGGNGDGGGNEGNRYRPEVNAYLANAMIANELFMMQLSDRQYVQGSHRLWMRMDGSFRKFKSGLTGLKTDVDSFVFQAGYDFYRAQMASGTLSVGAMIAYGHAESKTRNPAIHFRADTETDAFALGLYGTYMGNQGTYIDSWIQYVYANNRVKGHHVADEKYKSKGILLSLEVGHQFSLTESLFITPQAQVTYMGVKMDNHQERNGTRIQGNRDNIQIRLGARIQGEYRTNHGLMKPFAEINYIHNTSPHYLKFTDYQNITERVEQAGAKNIGQVKLGLESDWGEQSSFFGEVSYAFGKDGYKNAKVGVGVRYRF